MTTNFSLEYKIKREFIIGIMKMLCLEIARKKKYIAKINLKEEELELERLGIAKAQAEFK